MGKELTRNLTSVFHGLKAEIPGTLKSGSGRSLVNNVAIGGVASTNFAPGGAERG
jgi:hypothetical protein